MSRIELAVLETRPTSQEYPWIGGDVLLSHRLKLSGAQSPEQDPPRALLDPQLAEVLRLTKPDVVVCVGWADPSYQRLMVLCHRAQIPLVMVSDSKQRDHARSAPKEWMKQQLVRGFSSALVAGTESLAYLKGLGLPDQAIFKPWDVVDSDFFAAGKAESGCRSEQDSHFLCVGRFIAEKNYKGLLDAYALYQQQGGRWGLMLIGGGSEEESIRAQISKLPQPDACQLKPFLDHFAIRQCYAAASALVLASVKDTWGLVVNEAMAAGLPCLVSSACGCAVDLIESNITGWSFNPDSPADLAALMHTAEHQSPSDREAMIEAAEIRIKMFSLESFAVGFQAAIDYALHRPRFSKRAALMAGLISSDWLSSARYSPSS